MDKTERQKWMTRFCAQRLNAQRRGVEFKLTFQEWLDWWGEDLHLRGSKPWQLQMQRMHDKGAYEIGNIVKGHPAKNARTAANVRLAAQQKELKRKHQEALDRAMFEESKEPREEDSADISPTLWACNGNTQSKRNKGFAIVKEV